MPELRIADLVAALPGDLVVHVEPARIQEYRAREDPLPPFVVFQTEEGLLLADGHHRLAAARARGDETIEVELRRGSRSEALGYAAETAAAQRGISVATGPRVHRHRSRFSVSPWVGGERAARKGRPPLSPSTG